MKTTWNTALRLWWAVAWRTFVWVSLPLMLVQLTMTWLQTPELAHAMLGVAMMMLAEAPAALAGAVMTPEFWFFAAITTYSFIGALTIYKHLLDKGTFGGLTLKAEPKK